MAGRRSVEAARSTRERILRQAADIASVEGLGGISIGRLAAELDMSKSGVIGHFGSMEELQLATVDFGSEIFRSLVWDPVVPEQRGRPRLLAVCDTWSAYSTNPPYPGGCLIATASMEFAGQGGRVHERLAEYLNLWHRTLAAEVDFAIEHGQLPGSTDADSVAYILQALTSSVKTARYLSAVPETADRCRTAMRAVLAGNEVGPDDSQPAVTVDDGVGRATSRGD
jgi:AcrR family transcriptional regulator